MGLMGSWFLSDDLATLKAILPTLTNEKEIEICKKKIEELENE